MAKTPSSAMLIRTPAAAPNIKAVESGMMTPNTRAELLDLCNRTGEPFEENLTERQARRRISQLSEIDSLNS